MPRWEKPRPSFFKYNINAAFFKNERIIGTGFVFRDEYGKFVVCRTRMWHGLYEVKEGEAFGLLEALSWIHGGGYKRFCSKQTPKKWLMLSSC